MILEKIFPNDHHSRNNNIFTLNMKNPGPPVERNYASVGQTLKFDLWSSPFTDIFDFKKFTQIKMKSVGNEITRK